VELFEQIRREYEFGVGTIQGVARKLGVHRRLVREALASAVPLPRKLVTRAKPRVDAIASFVEAILVADRQAPRKQRHTAHRIYTRLRAERPELPISEGSVRRYVRERKLSLGFAARETFVPQSYPWGQEGQVDWYEATVELDGAPQVVQVFSLRSMASGAAFHRAYLRATQQAFLDAHEHAFAYFGGVFRVLRYDNLKAAVTRVLRGSRREETARFVAFRSHWRFDSEFCTPGEGHEKGGVEGEAGQFRRNHLVPVPVVADMAALNGLLLAGCRADEGRTIHGRTEPIGAALAIEREHLLPLASEGFDLDKRHSLTVDHLGRVKVLTNAYSAPVRAGTAVEARVGPATVSIWHGGRCVATHERHYGRYQEVLDLEHYLDVLAHKPGAFAGSTPLAQWRRTGRWPTSYDTFWGALVTRLGKGAGTKAMISLLQLGQTHGQASLREAIETALKLGCHDVEAVRHLLTSAQLRHRPVTPDLDARLACYDRPPPSVADYDALLTAAR